MYCKNCGKPIEEDATFCKYCGSKLKASNSSKTKEVFDGEVHRCPNCGTELDAFVTICPSCGHELRGIKSGSKVEELSKKLEIIDNSEKQKTLIANFYVPNTKEDLIEFFTLAFTQINNDTPLANAWRSKVKQTLIKAKLAIGKTVEYKYLLDLYERDQKEQNEIKKKNEKILKRKRIGSFIANYFVWFVLAIALLGEAGIVIYGGVLLGKGKDDLFALYLNMVIWGILFIILTITGCINYAKYRDKKNKKETKGSENSTSGNIKKTKLTYERVNFLDGPVLSSWFAKRAALDGDQRAIYHCKISGLNFSNLKLNRRDLNHSVYQFIKDGNDVVAHRILIYSEINEELESLFKKNNGILIIK